MKVCIVGAGRTGSQIAFALLLSNIPHLSMSLVDIDSKKLKGEFLDLKDANNLLNSLLISAFHDVKNFSDSDIFIITAGKARLNSKDIFALDENLNLVRSICEKIGKKKPIWIVTNPTAEICSKLTEEGFDASPIGTMLDNSRLSSGKSPHEHAGEIIDSKGFTAFGVAIEVFLKIKDL